MFNSVDVKIYLGGNHRTDCITTYPFGHINQKIFNKFDGKGHPSTKGEANPGLTVEGVREDICRQLRELRESTKRLFCDFLSSICGGGLGRGVVRLNRPGLRKEIKQYIFNRTLALLGLEEIPADCGKYIDYFHEQMFDYYSPHGAGYRAISAAAAVAAVAAEEVVRTSERTGKRQRLE